MCKGFFKIYSTINQIRFTKASLKSIAAVFSKCKGQKYQIWERNPLSVDIWSRKVLWQKLQYMHLNPVRAELCRWPEEYYWSSAMFYHTGVDKFGFLTHVMD
jgi:putative transposase